MATHKMSIVEKDRNMMRPCVKVGDIEDLWYYAGEKITIKKKVREEGKGTKKYTIEETYTVVRTYRDFILVTKDGSYNETFLKTDLYFGFYGGDNDAD